MKSPRTWIGARWRPVFRGRYEISLSDVIGDHYRIKNAGRWWYLLVAIKASRSSRCRSPSRLKMMGLRGGWGANISQ